MTDEEVNQQIKWLSERKLNRHERRKLHKLKVQAEKMRRRFVLRQLEK